MDKYESMQLFIHTSRSGSFTAAADELNLTQSAVSKKIAWLEKKLGFTLFHRNSRKIQLTTQGKNYLSYCKQALDEMTYIESQLKGELNAVIGELRLSVPSAMATQILAKPISDFMAIHPQLTVNISVNDRQVDLIESKVDIAIRVATLPDSGYKARFLFNNQSIMFASPSYLKDKGTPKTAEELTTHQCLVYSLKAPSNIWSLTDSNNTTVKVKVKERVKSDSAEMLLKMSLMGHGISALPNWMVKQHIDNGRLTAILVDYQSMSLPMYAVFKADGYQPYRIQAFVNFLAEYFQDNID
ncbi:LysR family transcriptional regulator [Shewanella woodyi]|uniref:Transcriptional regulator, LysR family n=1 Tax=Shewanella woodyi (strain ATCC 51908 / MS32) TaxID=392500 RepID=B1KFL5_SHEWM|nr:LysR family transcriptional regulator [Shewanella woodyi]ACA88190.1 transcriptional regulator, LysR family [Shewanella woodyi ATCC 51908]